MNQTTPSSSATDESGSKLGGVFGRKQAIMPPNLPTIKTTIGRMYPPDVHFVDLRPVRVPLVSDRRLKVFRDLTGVVNESESELALIWEAKAKIRQLYT